MKYDIPKNARILSVDGDYTENIDYSTMRGLKIETDKGDIKLMISDIPCCCENWDALYLETPDNLDKIVGAKILEISDIEIKTGEYNQNSCDLEETQLRVTTTKGIIQFAVYNEHNGYYAHATFLQVFDIKEDGDL